MARNTVLKRAPKILALKFVDALNFKSAEKKKYRKFCFSIFWEDEESSSEAQDYLSEFGIVAYHNGGSALKGLVSERLALGQ